MRRSLRQPRLVRLVSRALDVVVPAERWAVGSPSAGGDRNAEHAPATADQETPKQRACGRGEQREADDVGEEARGDQEGTAEDHQRAVEDFAVGDAPGA